MWPGAPLRPPQRCKAVVYDYCKLKRTALGGEVVLYIVLQLTNTTRYSAAYTLHSHRSHAHAACARPHSGLVHGRIYDGGIFTRGIAIGGERDSYCYLLITVVRAMADSRTGDCLTSTGLQFMFNFKFANRFADTGLQD